MATWKALGLPSSIWLCPESSPQHHSCPANCQSSSRPCCTLLARHAQLQSQTENFVKELEEQGFEEAEEGVEEEELSGQASDLQSQLESLKNQVS